MIHIAQYWTPAYDCLAELTWHTKVNYAKKHGYQTHSEHLTSNNLCLERVHKWLQLLEKTTDGDWILFVGCDTLITQPQLKLEAFLHPNQDTMFVVSNEGMFSDGVFIQSNPDTRRFMREVCEMVERDSVIEQHAFTILLSGLNIGDYVNKVTALTANEFWKASETALNAGIIDVGILTNDFIGDYQDIHYGGCWVADLHAWHDKTFMLHMGGKSLDYRMMIMPSFLPKPKKEDL